jgi:transcription-repair coupling factor (superfamily II helicase)
MADQLDEIKRQIERGTRVISLSGLISPAAKASVLARLRTATGRTFAVVTASNSEMESWLGDLSYYAGDDDEIIALPSFEIDPYSGASPHAETQERRALALWQMRRRKAGFVILPARSLIQRTVSPAAISAMGCVLRRDTDLPPEQLVETLFAGGYVREEPLFGPGQFSVRGGIIDIWSPDAVSPARIEFFGDTIDSIRTFDPDTQLSIAQINEFAVAPMREMAVTARDLKDWAFFARERFAEDKYFRNLKDRTDFADEGESFSGWEFLMPLVKPLDGTVFDHLPASVLCDRRTVDHRTHSRRVVRAP